MVIALQPGPLDYLHGRRVWCWLRSFLGRGWVRSRPRLPWLCLRSAGYAGGAAVDTLGCGGGQPCERKDHRPRLRSVPVIALKPGRITGGLALDAAPTSRVRSSSRWHLRQLHRSLVCGCWQRSCGRRSRARRGHNPVARVPAMLAEAAGARAVLFRHRVDGLRARGLHTCSVLVPCLFRVYSVAVP